MTLQARFADSIDGLLGPDFPDQIGVAVSGGGDSMALLHLAADWAGGAGVTLWVATIDHGLREASADEAALVAQACAALGVGHTTLTWEGWDGRGNLQDAARQARLELLNRWRGGVGHVLMGHTADDQAETVLMRLARGSGVDGLAGIPVRRRVRLPQIAVEAILSDNGPPWPDTRTADFAVLRPLLSFRRDELRAFLRGQGVTWAEDPSNDDPGFDRVKARAALAAMEPLGITADGLTATAGAMRRARAALGHRAVSVAEKIGSVEHGDIIFDRDGLADVEEETRLRLVSAALQFVSSSPYRPRLQALERALAEAMEGRSATLQGALIHAAKGRLHICREHASVAQTCTATGSEELWDNRWLCYGPEIKGLEVRALGEGGLGQIETRPDTAPPRASLIAQPAIWDGEVLIACQAAAFGKPYVQELRPPGGGFTSLLVSH